MTAITVIIPVHNRCVLLARAVRSVLRQTMAAAQVIIVDDGSSDDPVGYLQCMDIVDDTVEFIHQVNQGVSGARNAGLRKARHDWIAFLDSDDEWLPDKLAAQCRVVGQPDNPVVCHTEEIWFRDGRRVNPMVKHKKPAGRIYQHCLPLCAMSPSTVLLHKSVIDSVGDFDESLPACEDYDLWLRLSARFEVALVDEPLIRKYGGHADQLSQRYWGMDRFRVKSLLNILDDDCHLKQLSPGEVEQTRAITCRKLRVLINGSRKRGRPEQANEWQTQLDRLSFDSRQSCV